MTESAFMSSTDDIRYEIEVNGTWIKVVHYIFRSWSGGRRINGQTYVGPVYYVGSDRPNDICHRGEI